MNYKEVRHIVGGEAEEVQKVNRVYASKDKVLWYTSKTSHR